MAGDIGFILTEIQKISPFVANEYKSEMSKEPDFSMLDRRYKFVWPEKGTELQFLLESTIDGRSTL